LRGTKKADLLVEQATKFDALGLTAPPTLLASADEVIQ
jgi:hypothetical protein